jgi:hypothetical protein
VHQREVAAIAGGMQRRRGFRQVLTDDARVAYTAIRERQFVVCESDRTRVVRQLRTLERARVERNGARLIPASGCQPAVQSP